MKKWIDVNGKKMDSIGVYKVYQGENDTRN